MEKSKLGPFMQSKYKNKCVKADILAVEETTNRKVGVKQLILFENENLDFSL